VRGHVKRRFNRHVQWWLLEDLDLTIWVPKFLTYDPQWVQFSFISNLLHSVQHWNWACLISYKPGGGNHLRSNCKVSAWQMSRAILTVLFKTLRLSRLFQHQNTRQFPWLSRWERKEGRKEGIIETCLKGGHCRDCHCMNETLKSPAKDSTQTHLWVTANLPRWIGKHPSGGLTKFGATTRIHGQRYPVMRDSIKFHT
jgi:hypothetical protein